jgi:hypothetical protein
MDSFVPTAALAITVFTFISLLRFLRGQDWNGAFTILSVWASGMAGVWLFAQSAWGETTDLAGLTGGVPLADLSGASIIIVGLQVGSAAVGFNELRGAIDNTSSTAKPPLLEHHVDHVDPAV